MNSRIGLQISVSLDPLRCLLPALRPACISINWSLDCSWRLRVLGGRTPERHAPPPHGLLLTSIEGCFIPFYFYVQFLILGICLLVLLSAMSSRIRKYESRYEKCKKKKKIEELTRSQKGALDRFLAKESNIFSENQCVLWMNISSLRRTNWRIYIKEC